MRKENVVEENVKEQSKKKKQRRQRHEISKQTLMTMIMVVVSVATISISTYAWFLITNTPKANQLTLTADTLGELQIADITGEGKPETYMSALDLSGTTKNNAYLSPATTQDGLTFYSPNYMEGEVTSLSEIKDTTILHTKYVYEKVFYLRAGKAASEIDQNKAKNYDIFLVGTSTNSDNGCYMKDQGADVISAANALRVSLTFEGGITGVPVTKIYEPNADMNNNGVLGQNMAYFTDPTANNYGQYTTITQNANRNFTDTADSQSRSAVLDTIREGEDIKVTMRIWLEGTDKDCVNEVAADKILGQIQFISEENLDQFQVNATMEEETTTTQTQEQTTTATETTTVANEQVTTAVTETTATTEGN